MLRHVRRVRSANWFGKVLWLTIILVAMIFSTGTFANHAFLENQEPVLPPFGYQYAEDPGLCQGYRRLDYVGEMRMIFLGTNPCLYVGQPEGGDGFAQVAIPDERFDLGLAADSARADQRADQVVDETPPKDTAKVTVPCTSCANCPCTAKFENGQCQTCNPPPAAGGLGVGVMEIADGDGNGVAPEEKPKKIPTKTLVDKEPKQIVRGSRFALTGTLVDENGKPLAGKKIIIKSKARHKDKWEIHVWQDKDGKWHYEKRRKVFWRVLEEVTTDAKGKYKRKRAPKLKRSIIYKAVFPGEGDYLPSESEERLVKVIKKKKPTTPTPSPGN